MGIFYNFMKLQAAHVQNGGNRKSQVDLRRLTCLPRPSQGRRTWSELATLPRARVN
jgi:hypothetical protein